MDGRRHVHRGADDPGARRVLGSRGDARTGADGRPLPRERRPAGGTSEFQHPDYPSDPEGKRIPLDAHIRLPNPRVEATADQRILRRGYNYRRGIGATGDLDQGLVFVAFNQNPPRQFVRIQKRLEQEPMVDYITPVGGGYFFAPPGSRSIGDWVGSGLALA